MDKDGNLVQQWKALASNIGTGIIRILAQHKPEPVPVRVIAAELGVKRSTASTHLAQLLDAELIAQRGRRKGYSADSEYLRAVIGPHSYKRITQDLGTKNKDAPERS